MGIEVRKGFVRKVYSLLTIQLFLTVIIAVPFQFLSTDTLDRMGFLLTILFFVLIGMICGISCCHQVFRQFPANYIFLFAFTVVEGLIVGYLSARYTWQSVILAAGVTVGIFFTMTLYACFTKTDFSGAGPYLFGALMSLIFMGFAIMILSFFTDVRWLVVLLDLCGVLLFTFYIVYDTQKILGSWGGHKYEYSVDDYVFASISLYLDIINLFLCLLSLFGVKR